MTDIMYKSGDVIQLEVNQADNVLIGYLGETGTNRRKIYSRDTDYGIQFKDVIDISHSLRANSESLLLTGINFTSVGNICFKILVNDVEVACVSENLPENSSRSWEFSIIS